MSIEALRNDLVASREALLAALEGVTQEDFVRTAPDASPDAPTGSIRDLLWHLGLVDDWTRRVVDQARGGRRLDAFEVRRRPVHLETPELLRRWLEQTRRATLVLLAKIDEEALERPFEVPGGSRTAPSSLLADLSRRDREVAARVRELRRAGLPAGEQPA